MTTDLANYGYVLFEDNYEWIIKEDFNDIYELAGIIFENAEIDGSLTFNSYKAREELFGSHDITEVFDLLNDWGITMKYAAEHMYEETLHVAFAKQDFIDSLENEYEDICDLSELLTEKEKILAAIANHIEEGISKYPRLKAARKKLEISLYGKAFA